MAVDTHGAELLPAYVLDCLAEQETIRVSEHLPNCAVCRAELQTYQDTIEQLALTAPDAVPSPDLERQLMERIQVLGPAAPVKPKTSWGGFLLNFRRTGLVWGIVSLVLILGLAVGNLLLWQWVNPLEGAEQAASFKTISLTGTEVAPGAAGLIVISLDGEQGTLVVDCLPKLDAGHEYQLWLIQAGHQDSGAVFVVDRDGYSSVWVSSPKPLSSYSAFGVSIEPAGGSPAPTGDKVLSNTWIESPPNP